jgi:hypothetical protein
MFRTLMCRRCVGRWLCFLPVRQKVDADCDEFWKLEKVSDDES